MRGLLSELYDKKRQTVIEDLYNNSSVKDQLLIRSSIAKAFEDCPRLIPSHATDWLLCVLCKFDKPEDDTMRILNSVHRYIRQPMSFGLLDEDLKKWKDIPHIADSCLVGLSFFKPRMEWMHHHRSAPSPDYYKEAGALAFKRSGFDDISEEFSGWIEFLNNELAYSYDVMY